ncbi:MAG: hypothetical protein M3Y28_06260 [Armatimonadota bacterium]|nr:hypothetical protein [Armatimonadota bacterium]
MMKNNFQLETIEPLTLVTQPPLSEMYTLSPFVWRDGADWEMLLRAVPCRDDKPELKIARIYHGRSTDGLRFTMGDRPVIAPGPGDQDRDGCEDPTVVFCDNVYSVFYSGWNESDKQGQLLLASGPDCERLKKRGGVLSSTPDIANPKEATVARAADGTWRLFFEYAAEDASQIGLASAPTLDGPWTVGTPPFRARPGAWDAWHLSAGPMLVGDPDRPVMFYNGATKDAHWRIGWIAFDPDFTQVVARCEDPFITPPPSDGDDTDIAFAASAVEEGGVIHLYYSVSDKDLFRATIRRV